MVLRLRPSELRVEDTEVPFLGAGGWAGALRVISKQGLPNPRAEQPLCQRKTTWTLAMPTGCVALTHSLQCSAHICKWLTDWMNGFNMTEAFCFFRLKCVCKKHQLPMRNKPQCVPCRRRVSLLLLLWEREAPMIWGLEEWGWWEVPESEVQEVFAAQFGHRLPGHVIQVPRPFIVHCDRQDHAVGHRVQILHQTVTLLLKRVGVKPKEGETAL